MITEKIDKYLTEKTFKAPNFNKIEDAAGFFAWGYSDAAKVSGLRPLTNPKTIGDVIFWLNMAAQGWELIGKNK